MELPCFPPRPEETLREFLRPPLSTTIPMNLPQNTPIPANSELEEALLLASRELDETLTGAEQARLAALENVWSKEVAQFRAQCRQLRNTLGSLPQTNVQVPLWKMSGLSDSQTPAPRPIVAGARRGTQKLILGSVSVVICALLLLIVRAPQTELASSERVSPKAAVSAAAASPAKTAVEQEALLADSDAMGGVGGGSVVGLNSQAIVAEESDVPDDSIQPLIESENWNVVVVKVEGQDRDQVMDRIQSIVHAHGLRLQRSAGQEEPEWLGVVLTSSVEGSNEVLDAMEQSAADSTNLTTKKDNVTAKAKSSGARTTKASAEIVAAVRRSLQYPTLSELHHGRVFVALPTEAEFQARAVRKGADRSAPRSSDNLSPDKAARGEDAAAENAVLAAPAPRGAVASSADGSQAADNKPLAEMKRRSEPTVALDAAPAEKATEASVAVVTLVVFDFGVSLKE
jgi:hypothetical protein